MVRQGMYRLSLCPAFSVSLLAGNPRCLGGPSDQSGNFDHGSYTYSVYTGILQDDQVLGQKVIGEMMILRYIFYFLLAYLSGGIMFGYWIPKIFCGLDVRELSKDGNPGTANAFTYAGPAWGMLVLICDILKGFLPVHLAAGELGTEQMGFALIMAYPGRAAV